MADRSEVVVIGGGVLGASAALHLLAAGVRDVRLIERDGLFQGTSAAGGGFLGPWTALAPIHGAASRALPIERYGMDFYAEMDAAGHDIDYRHNGILWVAASEATWAQVQQMAWDTADPDSYTVDPDDLRELTGGIVSPEGVHGAKFMPSGAQVFTTKVGRAMADRIRRDGGVIETRRPATGLVVRGGRVRAVETPHGRIDCDTVVLAAGAWSNELLRPLGVYIPAVPQITSRLITGDLGIPAALPVLMLQGMLPGEPGDGTVLWVRGHGNGLLWGGMYTTYPRNVLVATPMPERLDELPIDGVLENQRAARAARFMPALSRPTSIRIKHGAPCYTPDNMALMGPVPGVAGLHVMGGDNEVGFTHGPGFGRLIADHIVRGSSELADLGTWRIDRFGDRYRDPAEAFAGVAESLGELFDEDGLFEAAGTR
jgi:sarcosine oxidase, subunit beta